MKPGGETEAALNGVLGRQSARADRSKIHAERLFGLFDRFVSPGFHDEDPRDGKCRATGTCDNIA